MARKKPSKTTLNAALDRLASIAARERTKGRCERCGEPATQVHHVLSRRYRRLRWDKRNLVAICSRDHMLAHHSPILFLEWFKSVRPDDYAFIKDPENSKPITRSVADLEDLRDQLKDAA